MRGHSRPEWIENENNFITAPSISCCLEQTWAITRVVRSIRGGFSGVQKREKMAIQTCHSVVAVFVAVTAMYERTRRVGYFELLLLLPQKIVEVEWLLPPHLNSLSFISFFLVSDLAQLAVRRAILGWMDALSDFSPFASLPCCCYITIWKPRRTNDDSNAFRP